nr:cytochrome P450 [Bemisia tabaci]
MISHLTLNLIFILLLLIGYLISHYKKKYEYWKSLGIPYVGISGDLTFQPKTNRNVTIQEQYKKLAAHPFGGIYDGAKPVLLIRDPELIRAILIKDFSHFTDRGIVVNEEIDPLNAHLITLQGQRWRNIRIKLVPTFSSGKLRAMYPLMEQCTKVLDGYLDAKLKSSPELEVGDLMMRFAADVIGVCALGLDCHAIADEESEFRAAGRRMKPLKWKFFVRQVLRSIHPKIIPWLRWKATDRKAEDFFMGVTREAIKHREENQDKRTDFMQLLINLQHEEQKTLQDGAEPLFTDHVVAAHVMIFFLAGFETVSSAVSSCLYELALNPSIANKLHAEIERVLAAHGGKLDYDSLKEMHYMETLRKYPNTGFLKRICTKAYEIPNSSLLIKEGTNVLIPTYSLHHDPQYFPEPEKFDPDRFNEENRSNIVQGAYIPFGDGPRKCIGKKFAMMEARAALASIMRKYTVHPTSKTQIPLVFADGKSGIPRPERGIHLRFQARGSQCQ